MMTPAIGFLESERCISHASSRMQRHGVERFEYRRDATKIRCRHGAATEQQNQPRERNHSRRRRHAPLCRVTIENVTVLPATPDRWPDVEAIFGAKGCSVARGCWCMHYRRSGSASSLSTVASRSKVYRAGLKALVDAGKPPGLIAYCGKKPVGWVSLAPRDEFAKLK